MNSKRKCKYCGGVHEWNKAKCLAYGKECQKCHKLNHFAAVCKSKRQTVKQVEDSSESTNYDEVRVVDGNDRRSSKGPEKLNHFPKRFYALIKVGNQRISFQLDSGATCNVISLYNKVIVQPVGKCVLQLRNEKANRC